LYIIPSSRYTVNTCQYNVVAAVTSAVVTGIPLVSVNLPLHISKALINVVERMALAVNGMVDI